MFKIVEWIIKPIVSVFVGQTALTICHAKGWYPEKLLADAIMTSPTSEAIQAIYWALSLVITVAVWWLISWWPTRWWYADKKAEPTRLRYSRRKVERLRAAARSLRDVAWGVVPIVQAEPLLKEFREASEDFLRQPGLDHLLLKIEGGAQRLAIMAARLHDADLIARKSAIQETHAGIDHLLRLTDEYVLYEENSDGDSEGKIALELLADMSRRIASIPLPRSLPDHSNEINAPALPTDKTPEELLSLYNGRTKIQGDKEMQPHVGKSIVTDGVILAVADSWSLSVTIQRASGRRVVCSFDRNWLDKLATHHEGDELSIKGVVRLGFSSDFLALHRCEVISHVPRKVS